MSKEKPMIRAETVRYEAVARVLTRVRDILDDLAPDLENMVETCLTNRPDMTFEEVVTEVVKECTFQLKVFDALA